MGRIGKCASLFVATILVLSVFAGILVLAPLDARAQATVTGVGPWTQQGNYGSSSTTPGQGGLAILGVSCVTYSGYVYCVGGQNSQGTNLSDVFYAPLSGGSVGAWTETTDYGATSGTSGSGGVPIEWPSCVQYDGYIYCVGGVETSAVFFAQLSSSGVGAWTETTDYGAASGSTGKGGIAGFQISCVADADGYMYCVGNSSGTSKVFYAQLSSSGVGPWTETTDYGAASGSSGTGGVAIGATACVDDTGYIYCVGGTVSYKPVSDVFYAPVSSSGVGAWTESTDYGASSGSSGTGGVPIFGTTCVTDSPYVICLSGDTTGPTGTSDVFYGKDGAISVWIQTGDDPEDGYWWNCVYAGGFVYCWAEGGDEGWDAPVQPTTETTTTETTTTETTTTVVCAYTAMTSGNWNNPSIWNPTPVAPFPQTLPAGCTANIPSGVTVTIPAGVTITSLGDIENHGMLSNLGVLNSNGIFNNFGSLNNFGGATFANGGTLTNTGGVTNYSGGTFTNAAGATITNSASGEVSNDGSMTNSGKVSNSGNLTNFSGGTLTNSDGGTIINFGSGTLTNKGTLTNDEGAVLSSNGALTNAMGGMLTNSGTLNNLNGTMTNSGTLGNTGTLTNTGTLSNSVGATLTNTGQGNLENDDNLTNSGTVNNGATLTNTGSLDNEENATLTNTDTLTNNGDLWNGGTITNAAGAELDNTDTMVNANVLNNYGTMTNAAGGTLSLSGLSVVYNYPGAMLNNNAGADIETSFFASIVNTGTFNNQGTFNARAESETETETSTETDTYSPLTSFVNADTSNELGSVNADGSAFLTNEHILDNEGTITIAAGGTLDNNGTITNSGSIANNGTINNLGTIDNSGMISGSGTLTGNAIVEESSTSSVSSQSTASTSPPTTSSSTSSPTSTSTQPTASTTQPSTSTTIAPPPPSSTTQSSSSSTSSSGIALSPAYLAVPLVLVLAIFALMVHGSQRRGKGLDEGSRFARWKS